MEHLRVESAGVAFQRNRQSRVLSWCALVTSSFFLVSPLFGLALYPWIGALMNLVGLHFGPERAPGKKKERPARVEVGDDRITITALGAPEIIRRDQIEMGWIDWFGGENRVVLKLANSDTVWILTRDEDEARRLLRGLGLSAEQHVYVSRLVSTLEERFSFQARSCLGVLLGGAGIVASLVAVIAISEMRSPRLPAIAGLLITALLILAVLTQIMLPRRVLVGTDGVTIKRVGAKRFIPYGEVTDVRADARGVWLDLGKEPVLLATMPRPIEGAPAVTGRLAPQTITLLARIREAMASGRGGQADAARFDVLERRGRPIDEWRREVAGLASGGAAGDYRRVPIERDDLVRIVEDGAAPPERRLGAAMALSSSDDEAMRGRVRIAAEACADDALRVAIEKAAEGELEEDDVERVARVRIS